MIQIETAIFDDNGNLHIEWFSDENADTCNDNIIPSEIAEEYMQNDFTAYKFLDANTNNLAVTIISSLLNIAA